MRALALTAALAGCAGHGIPSVPWGDAGARDVTVKDVSTTTDTAAYVVADAPRSEAAVDAASDASVDGSVDATRDATADAFADGSLDAATDVPVDAPPWFPCAPGVQRDLDALGTRVGDTTTVHGDNRAAGAMTVLPSACAVGYAGYEVAYRYVPRRTTTLRVSTNAMGTDARLDTVVFALSACLPLDGGGFLDYAEALIPVRCFVVCLCVVCVCVCVLRGSEALCRLPKRRASLSLPLSH